MGQVITVMNMKGGVGKTTVCIHVGGVLGRSSFNKRVLLIDYDPQFNLSQALLRSKRYFQLEKDNKTCLQILHEKDTDLDPYVIQVPASATPPKVSELAESVSSTKAGGKIDLVPSTLDLMYVALGTSTGSIATLEERFRRFIDQARHQYDVVLIDCHPAGSILTKTSLQNSDHVLIPVAPQSYASRGVALMTRFIESNRIGNTSPAAHILFNLMPRSGPIDSVEKDIRTQYGGLCVTRTLKRYKVFSEPQEGTGFVWFSGKPYSTEAYSVLWSLVDELVGRMKL